MGDRCEWCCTAQGRRVVGWADGNQGFGIVHACVSCRDSWSYCVCGKREDEMYLDALTPGARSARPPHSEAVRQSGSNLRAPTLPTRIFWSFLK
jgi:hypothetical protein